MKTLAKILASALLLINGAGAVYGGANLMLYPDGSSLRRPYGRLVPAHAIQAQFGE